MRRKFFLVGFLVVTFTAPAQKFVLTEGVITFFSKATLEDISAENTKISGIFNPGTHEIAFVIPNNQFQFEKKLMQQHFNEKYMESDKFPRSTFSGTLEGFENFKPGEQVVTAIGELTIHGVTKIVEVPGTIEVAQDRIFIKSKFMIKLADYSIKIPQLLWQNIAETIEVTVTVTFIHKPQ